MTDDVHDSTNKVHVRIHCCESAANYLFILLAFFVVVSFIIQLCEMFHLRS